MEYLVSAIWHWGVRIVALVKIEIGDRASRRGWAEELVEGVAVVAWCIKGCSAVMTQQNPDKEWGCEIIVLPCCVPMAMFMFKR